MLADSFGDSGDVLRGAGSLRADTERYTEHRSTSSGGKFSVQLPRLKGVFEQPFAERFCSGLFGLAPRTVWQEFSIPIANYSSSRHSNADFFPSVLVWLIERSPSWGCWVAARPASTRPRSPAFRATFCRAGRAGTGRAGKGTCTVNSAPYRP